MTVALVTDSNAQLPAGLRDRYGVLVVPLTIVIDGVAFREGADIATADFYARLARGAAVSTSAPSPGDVLDAYEAAAAAGASEILSIHIGSNTSATVNAVNIAARQAPVPVTVVDTGTASFAVGCCVWAAGEALAATGVLDAARAAAEVVAAGVGNVFVVGALALAASGGRLAADAHRGTGDDAGDDAGAPVLALSHGQMNPVARVHDIDAAVDAMGRYIEDRAGGMALRIGVGDAQAEELALALIARLERLAPSPEIIRYEVGPSVGAHTGPGTVGAVFFAR